MKQPWALTVLPGNESMIVPDVAAADHDEAPVWSIVVNQMVATDREQFQMLLN
jgi:hypothetical protein